MNKLDIYQLNQLNQHFYFSVAEDFSASRQTAWLGWQELLPIITRRKTLKVLDIAAGNGRFLAFLRKHYQGQLQYYGLDSNQQLLKLAQDYYRNDCDNNQQTQWPKFDLVKNYLINSTINWPVKETFDLIVVFGLTHHLPSITTRLAFLKSLRPIINKNGQLIISNWQFARDQERFEKNILNAEKIKKNQQINIFKQIKLLSLLKKLEENDYLLDWRSNDSQQLPVRYCHDLTNNEMQSLAKKTGWQIKKTFLADGKSKKLNQYFILEKLI